MKKFIISVFILLFGLFATNTTGFCADNNSASYPEDVDKQEIS